MSRLPEGDFPDIGQRVRQLRGCVLTQQQVADAAGVSVDVITKLEQGERQTTSIGSLQRIARALDVDIAQLVGRPERVPPTGDLDVGMVAIRRTLTPVDDLVGRIADAEQAVDLPSARRAVDYAFASYWGGRYEHLTTVLPSMLTQLRATVHHASTDECSAANELLARGYWATGSTLVQLHEPDAAWQAIRLALAAVEQGADELLAAMLRNSAAWQLMRAGRCAEARQICVRTAESIEPHGEVELPHLSVYGTLILTGANAAGRDAQVDEAYHLAAQSTEVANRIGVDRADYETYFGPSQAVMQTVDVGVVTENFTKALDAAQRMPREPGLPLASRCRHLADRAMALASEGHHDEALEALLTAEAIGPDWIKHQTLPRRIVGDLIKADRHSQLREFARRLGVTG